MTDWTESLAFATDEEELTELYVVEAHAVTEKAVCLSAEVGGDKFIKRWVPLSQLRIGKHEEIFITDWFYQKMEENYASINEIVH